MIDEKYSSQIGCLFSQVKKLAISQGFTCQESTTSLMARHGNWFFTLHVSSPPETVSDIILQIVRIESNCNLGIIDKNIYLAERRYADSYDSFERPDQLVWMLQNESRQTRDDPWGRILDTHLLLDILDRITNPH